MPTRLKVIAFAALILLCCVTPGCGPSGRDLSDEQWLELHADVQQERSDMQVERAEFSRQRDLLEADRREWDQRERLDPVIATVIASAAMLACCALPLILAAFLSWPARSEPADHVVCELLIEDLVQQAECIDNGTEQVEHTGVASVKPRLQSPTTGPDP